MEVNIGEIIVEEELEIGGLELDVLKVGGGDGGAKEVHIGTDEPTGEELIWIDPSEEADEIPTKTSQLVNDSNFITEIPNEYAKKTDIPDVSNFITKDVNDLTNYYDKESISALVGNIEELLGDI